MVDSSTLSINKENLIDPEILHPEDIKFIVEDDTLSEGSDYLPPKKSKTKIKM